jgi:hypothetical protein
MAEVKKNEFLNKDKWSIIGVDNMGNVNVTPKQHNVTPKQQLDIATAYYNDSMVKITENTAIIHCRNFIDDDAVIIPKIDAISDKQITQSKLNRMDVNKQLCRQAYKVFQENSRDGCHEQNGSDGYYINQLKRIYFHDKTMQALFVLENDNPTNPTNQNQSMCIDIVSMHNTK